MIKTLTFKMNQLQVPAVIKHHVQTRSMWDMKVTVVHLLIQIYLKEISIWLEIITYKHISIGNSESMPQWTYVHNYLLVTRHFDNVLVSVWHYYSHWCEYPCLFTQWHCCVSLIFVFVSDNILLTSFLHSSRNNIKNTVFLFLMHCG